MTIAGLLHFWGKEQDLTEKRGPWQLSGHDLGSRAQTSVESSKYIGLVSMFWFVCLRLVTTLYRFSYERILFSFWKTKSQRPTEKQNSIEKVLGKESVTRHDPLEVLSV